MKFTLGKAISIETVPAPTSRARRGQFQEVYEKLGDLKRGEAMPITFATEKDGYTARGALRKLAQKAGEFLSSSYSEDRKTFYFWLEPKENIPASITDKPARKAA